MFFLYELKIINWYSVFDTDSVFGHSLIVRDITA